MVLTCLDHSLEMPRLRSICRRCALRTIIHQSLQRYILTSIIYPNIYLLIFLTRLITISTNAFGLKSNMMLT